MNRDRAVKLAEELVDTCSKVDVSTALTAVQIARLLLLDKQENLVKPAELPVNMSKL